MFRVKNIMPTCYLRCRDGKVTDDCVIRAFIVIVSDVRIAPLSGDCQHLVHKETIVCCGNNKKKRIVAVEHAPHLYFERQKFLPDEAAV